MILAIVKMAWSGVLINEIVYDPTSSDGTQEWLELCNSGTEVVDLTGFTVEAGGSSFATQFTFDGGTIAPGEYLVVGGGIGTWPTAFGDSFQNGGSESDGVRIKDATGTVVDTILYDSPNDNLLEGDGGDTSVTPAADVSETHSLGRWPDCTDTNIPGDDFADYDTPSPGAANPEQGGEDTGDTGEDTGDTGTSTTANCAGAEGVTINELYVESDAEWVELYNGGSTAVELAGWEFRYGSSSYKSPYTFDSGTIAPGDWFLIGATTGDLVERFDLGNSNGSVQLSCDGAPVDTVIYGADASAWAEDAATDGAAYAPGPDSGMSLARWQDGYDTNVCSDDLRNAAPTPDATNGDTCPPTCMAIGGEGLRINELLYNAASTDDGYEWVELYNAGTDPIQLDNFQLQAGTKTFGGMYTFPGCVTLEPGEFLVVGGSGVPEADHVSDDLSLGNGTSSADGVQIVDCEGTVLDRVFYGDGTPETDFFADGSTIETTAVAPTEEAYSIGRSEDGVDSDTIEDWRAFSSPTPGSSNLTETGKDDTGGDEPGGCASSNQNERPDGGGCSTLGALPLGGLELLAGLTALLRRRRS